MQLKIRLAQSSHRPFLDSNLLFVYYLCLVLVFKKMD
jgi:hypothetical protein